MGFVKKIWYPVVVGFAVLLICMTFYAAQVKAQPICVSSECGNPHHEHSQHVHKKKKNNAWIPFLTLGVGANTGVGIGWLIWGKKEAPSAPPAKAPEPQERVLTITPDIKVYQ